MMKHSLLGLGAGVTLVLAACGTKPAPEVEIESVEPTASVETENPLPAEPTETLYPAIVGAADNADATLSVDAQRADIFYYDFGEVTLTDSSYPLAFRVNLPVENINRVDTFISANEGFLIDSASDYQQGELFTIAVDTTNTATGKRVAEVAISGTTIQGETFKTTFVATAEVQ